MKAALIASAIAAATVIVSAQTDPLVGTWKLNVAQSHYSPGPPPLGQTTVFEPSKNGLKAESTTTRADGSTQRATTTFQFDGKEYELHGTDVKTVRSYSRPTERRLEWTEKRDGLMVAKAVTEVSQDGRTRTLRTTGRDLQGRPIDNVAVYDRVR